MRDLRELDKYRDVLQEHKLFGGSDDDLRKNGGCFWIPTKGSRKGLKVVASSGEIPVSQGWDHVSVSLPNRCPTWEEMCKVKDLFFILTKFVSNSILHNLITFQTIVFVSISGETSIRIFLFLLQRW